VDLLLMSGCRSLFVVLLALTAAGCGRGDEPRVEATAPPAASGQPSVARPGAPAGSVTTSPHPRIVFLGDSLTAGYGLAREASVPSLVQQRLREANLDYEVVNAGVSGDTSAGGLSRLEWALEGDVRILVVELGANDGLRGLPVEGMKRNLAEIITRAKGRGIRVVLTGMEAPRNWGPQYVADFREAFSDLADEHDVAFIPFYLEGVALNPDLNLSDGIHPNHEGARIIERNIWRTLEPLLDD
jgi:acyl-CoA thioesterase-1